MENNMVSFLKRAAEKSGFIRESYLEKNIPTISENIEIIPFFGDLRSTFLLSSFLLRPYQERRKKYLILASWPGFQHLFPYVNEYWSLRDDASAKSLAIGANNLYNASEANTNIVRTLNTQYFENVVSYADLQGYYKEGFTQKYWQEFGGIKRFLPEVSASRISAEFQQQLNRKPGKKVVIFPSIRMRSWQRNRVEYLQIPKEFWKHLIERLMAEGIVPVLYQNYMTYDMSPEFADQCIYLVPKTISDVLVAMRTIGCVLDFHSGVSRLAIAARCPFVAVDERARFIGHKDYEIDDLCCEHLRKQYLFSFSSMILTGGASEWDLNFIDNVLDKLKAFLGDEQVSQMSPLESYETVSYDKVRKLNAKRMGVHFIRKH